MCILYSNANIINCARTLGSFLILFRALYLSYHDIFVCPIGSLIACFICWSFLHHVVFVQSLILNIVWLPSSIRHWICAFDSTQIMRSAHLGEELTLYWLSKFFTHFGTWCQWGRSLEGLREWFILKFGLCLSVLPLMHSIFICLAWLYIYSGNCPKVYSWQCMQWIHVHHTCIHCGGVCSIYVGSTHIPCISCSCVSRVGFDMD